MQLVAQCVLHLTYNLHTHTHTNPFFFLSMHSSWWIGPEPEQPVTAAYLQAQCTRVPCNPTADDQ